MEILKIKERASSTSGCIGCLGEQSNKMCVKVSRLAMTQKPSLKPCVGNKIIYVEDKE